MQRNKIPVLDLTPARKPNSPVERVFQGGNFGLERKGIPLVLGLNFLALSVIISVVTVLEFRPGFRPLSWAFTLGMLGAAIIAKVPGRWYALLLFFGVIVATTMWGSIRPYGLLEQWFVSTFLFSGLYCIAIFAPRIYKHLRTKSRS